MVADIPVIRVSYYTRFWLAGKRILVAVIYHSPVEYPQSKSA